MFLDIVLLIVGLVAIVVSADILINSSTSIAKKLNIPIFIVGIVIVAFGTSAPELIIGIMSGVAKTNELTLGNIIGSGFSNIALILGITAFILPLKTDKSVVYKEIPMLIGVELILFGLLVFDNKLSLIDGIVLISCFVIFMIYIIIKTIHEQKQGLIKADIKDEAVAENKSGEIMPDQQTEKQDKWIKIIPMLLISIVGLFFGGNLTVDKSSAIALKMGLSSTFIGITVVSIATTLPELVASLTAVRKKQTEIVLGNCIGSNIFNILLVLGLSATINPIAFDTSLIIDLSLLIGLTVVVFFIALFKKKISRLTGGILFFSYLLYLTYKILSVTVFNITI